MAQRRTAPSSPASIASSSSVSRMTGRISRRNHKLTKESHNVLSAANQQQNPAQVVAPIRVLTGRPTSAPEPPFAVLSEGDGRRRSQENKRVGCDRRADTAPVQAKDPERAEDERDPVQSDAHQANQRVHGLHDAQTASFYRPILIIQRSPHPGLYWKENETVLHRRPCRALPWRKPGSTFPQRRATEIWVLAFPTELIRGLKAHGTAARVRFHSGAGRPLAGKELARGTSGGL